MPTASVGKSQAAGSKNTRQKILGHKKGKRKKKNKLRSSLLAGITSLITAMQSANTGVINATTAYSNARIVRDKTLYDASTGLVPIAGEVKQYVKSLFGATSPEYKQVSKLRFKS